MSMAQTFMLPDVHMMAARPDPAAYPGYGIRVSDIPNIGFGLQYSVATAWFSLSRVQSANLTTAANGTVTWVYPVAYPGGTVPKILANVIAPSGSTDIWNIQQDGAATNTQVALRVKRQSVASLLGIDVIIPIGTPGATSITVLASAP